MDFRPTARFVWQSGQSLRVNVFGPAVKPCGLPLASQACDTTLREMFTVDGTTWSFFDHGTPPGTTQIHLGPHSAIYDRNNARAYVFVVGDDNQLYARRWNMPGCSNRWCWESLGAPARTTDMRTPVAMTYWGNRVQVFVAAATSGSVHLYTRHFDGSVWQPWQDYGLPPNWHNGQPADPTNLFRPGFDLTGAAVWNDVNGNLRINVFGTLDPVTPYLRDAPHDGGQLVEFTWNGGAWVWGNPLLFPESSNRSNGVGKWMPMRFQTMDVGVVDTQTWERLVVVGMDEQDRIWEYAWRGDGWVWQRH